MSSEIERAIVRPDGGRPATRAIASSETAAEGPEPTGPRARASFGPVVEMKRVLPSSGALPRLDLHEYLPAAEDGYRVDDADDEESELELPLDRPLAELVSEYEKSLIERALRATRGNRSRAAKLLQTTERIIGYRVQQYGIDCRMYRD